MARLIMTQSAEATAKKFLPPVSQTLLAWHFLNESLEKAARNYAIGKPDASVIGAPTASTNYISFQSLSKYLQTSIGETANATFFWVAKTSDTLADLAHQPMFFGTFQQPAVGGGGNTFGISAAADLAGRISGFAARGVDTSSDSAAPARITGQTPSAWALYTLAVGNSSGTVITNQTNGASATAGVGSSRLLSTGKYRIGSGFQDYAGLCDMALWAAYEGVLSSDDIAKVVATIRAYMAGRSITV